MIPFLCRPQSKFAQTHVNNGILLMVANFVVGYPIFLLCLTPVYKTWLIVLSVAGGVFGLLSLVCMICCLSGKIFPIPLFRKYLEP
ncbi:MAG: hypothetical protein LBF38_07210 [Deltaproteobacteria bacterium]|nr:hypothetical protein [Deltaproteobacteria bacterium]